MENDVGTTIEKIKFQEQDKEAKLKEKREIEATIMTLNRSIRDVVSQTEKHQEEIKELTKGNDQLQAKLEVERIRRNAVALQLEACNKELKILKAQSVRNTSRRWLMEFVLDSKIRICFWQVMNMEGRGENNFYACKSVHRKVINKGGHFSKRDNGISKVWEIRSSLCDAVQNISDECDVWALLAKPIDAEPLRRVVIKPSENNEALCEERLKLARERRDNMAAERERLLADPEKGEEFIRSYIQQKSSRGFSTKIEVNENDPIKFSTSSAAQKTIRPIRSKPSDMPWYQPYSVLASVSALLIYFCILREENDIDLEFDKTLYERIQGLEKEQLLQSYRYNKENNLSVAEIEARLRELELAEAKSVA